MRTQYLPMRSTEFPRCWAICVQHIPRDTNIEMWAISKIIITVTSQRKASAGSVGPIIPVTSAPPMTPHAISVARETIGPAVIGHRLCQSFMESRNCSHCHYETRLGVWWQRLQWWQRVVLLGNDRKYESMVHCTTVARLTLYASMNRTNTSAAVKRVSTSW